MQRHRRDPQARGRAGRRVQEEGHQRHDGQPRRVPRPHHQGQSTWRAWATTRRTGTASRPSSEAARLHMTSTHCPEADGRRRRVPRRATKRWTCRTPRSRAGRRWRCSGRWGVTVFYQFFTRYVLNNSASWTEEIARYLLIGVVFVGAAIGVAKNNHIQVDLLYRYLPARWRGRWRWWSTCCASPSSARWSVLTVQMMQKMGASR